MVKYSLRKGLNKFNNIGEASVEKELNQLLTKITVAPMNVENTRKKEK